MRLLMLFLAVAAVTMAQTNETVSSETNAVIRVRVTGDRVSLRATPALDGYLLENAMLGDELLYLKQTNGWVGVQAPDMLDYWIARKYVKNGVVQPDRLNVRAGPSLNYAKLTELSAGDTITLRGEFNGWLKIAPPAGSCVWINAAYAKILYPPAPEAESEETLAQEPETLADEPAEGPMLSDGEVAAEPDQLPSLMLVLDKSRKQGEYVELPGVLRRANPGLYKLVLIDSGFEEPICLVRGRESQMERYLNRSMLIKGARYWVKDVDLPVIQPETIHLDPLLDD